MSNHIYTKPFGRFAMPQFQMLGVLLFIWGAYLIYLLNPISIPILVVGIVLFTAVIGIQINFTDKKHREYLTIFGYKFGKWNKLPKIDYVTVYVEHYSQDIGMLSIVKKDNFSKFKISLIVTKTQRFDAGLFNEKPLAMENGKRIAKALNTRLLDFTSREPKWIEL